MNNNLGIIYEYGTIGTDEGTSDCCNLKVTKKVYQELEVFAKTDKGSNVINFTQNGKYLKIKNYVGTIQTKSGYTLEILPKIYKLDTETESKEILVELLKILYRLPGYKHINSANFKNEKTPLLEIFITMFLEELEKIVKQGIKSEYIEKIDNLKHLKGKLIINNQIKKNYIHKERFFVEYDEYTTNRVENRLIKSTLKYLLKISKSHKNIRLIRLYMEMLFNVDYSFNYDSDFKKCKTDSRGMTHYRTILIWAKIFLKKDSFSSFRGDSIAFAILYPMEKLFENYVEYYLKKRDENREVISQAQGKELVKEVFKVRPDFLIKRKDDNCRVADAKWKIVENNNQFSQADFYQLFAYSKIYKTTQLEFYYPQTKFLETPKSFNYFDGTTITIIGLDMTGIIKEKSCK